MSSPVLVVCNDSNLSAARISRHLGQALTRLGLQSSCRDTQLARWACAEAEKTTPARREMHQHIIHDKWYKFARDCGYDTVISLDLHWLFNSQLFVENDFVRAIHSFWSGDVRSSLDDARAFVPAPRELINQPKVHHHCAGCGPMEDLQSLGLKQVRRSALAAPFEYLEARHPCAVRDRIAFTGNSGWLTPPSSRARQALDAGDNLAALRRLARQEILDDLTAAEPSASWLRFDPAVADLLAAATELRLAQPHTAALALLVEAGKTHSDALDFLGRTGAILDAAALVRQVNRYDRPALVLRLHRRGWLDVYGDPKKWAPFGVTARPVPAFSRLVVAYQKYAVHLNAVDGTSDVAASEELFEIAACGRLSLNLESPDVRACYAEGEIALADSDDALEAVAERVLKDPDAALAAGDKARARTAREHLWEHRLKKAFA